MAPSPSSPETSADDLASMEPALFHVSKRSLLIIAFATVAMLLLWKFLPVLPEYPKANAGLAILLFAGILWLTEAVHITITALIVPVLAVLFGLASVKSALAPFAEPTIFLFFGGFALATALHAQGIDRLIAHRLLHLAKGHFGWASIFLFLATAGLSMWISNTATAAMMLPLAIGILHNLDAEKEHNTYVFLLLGVAFSASIGGLGTLVGSPPNMIAVNYLHTVGVEIDFMTWMRYGIPVMLVMLPAMVAVLYFTLKPNLSHHIDVDNYHFEWTRPRRITVLIFLLTASCWIFSAWLKEYFGIAKDFDAFVALMAAVLIGVSGVASWKQIQKNTEWGVLFLFGGGLALSAILKDSGASAVLAHTVRDILGNGHWLLIMGAVATFIILLTELSSNTASAALMVPLFGAVGIGLGMPKDLLPIIIGIGASLAFMLPVATPPNAIVFGSGYIRQKEMIRCGCGLVVVSIIILTLFGQFVWK